VTHASFKALLFLAAGAVILSLHHEHDIFRMGGLWRRLPIAFVTFLIGSAALAGFPLITAGFYSKDLILWQTWAGPQGSVWLWGAGIVGALLTALYIFRVVFRVFFGAVATPVTAKPDGRIRFVLLILALLAIVAGWIDMPETLIKRLPAWAQPLRHLSVFPDLMHTALPALHTPHEGDTEWVLQIIAAAVSLVGIVLALGFLRRPRPQAEPAPAPWRQALYRLWLEGWGFDRFYDTIAVKPFVGLARINQGDVFDAVAKGPAWTATAGYGLLRHTQTGQVRRYAMGIAIGAVLTVAITVFL
jgi:NADH-quinone oxidoreductase subunit L